MTYAKGTSVSIDKSRAEIEKILRRYGASHFAYISEPERAVIAFTAHDRNIRFSLPLPDMNSKEFQRDGRGTQRTQAKRYEVWEQSCRERWRALALCIKAKLESVESGIETFDDAFLAHIVIGEYGQTVKEVIVPRLAQIYAGNSVPLLPPPGKNH